MERPLLIYPVAGLAAALIGALSYVKPFYAAGLLAAAFVVFAAWRRPVGGLVWLLFLTTIVPYSIQKLAGGAGPGLLPSDVLLILGMAWGLMTLGRTHVDRRTIAVGAVLGVYLVLAALQAVHGVRAGANISNVGNEFRIQLGLGAFFIASPILRDDAARRLLLRGMLILAIILGLWGIFQYLVNLPFSGTEDYGVRAGVSLTTGGRGQVQGGLYDFGLAVVLCTAAMLSGEPFSSRTRVVLWAAIVLNCLGLLVTFERTFWVATVLAVLLVVIRAGRIQRFRALIFLPLVTVTGVAVLSVIAPSEFTTARQRLVSIGQYTSDNSVRFRVVETRHVAARVTAAPIFGSGLGAAVYWGRPWERVPAADAIYTHDGYFWLMWKLGIPLAFVLFGLIAIAACWRRPPPLPPLERALRNGAQACLASLLLTSITFPAFNTLAVTAVMGVLLAIACLPPREQPALRVL